MSVIKVTGIEKTIKKLDKVSKSQAPFALSKTLSELAFQSARKDMPVVADKTFDGGATAYTKRAFKYKKATKKRLYSVVYIDSKTHGYLNYQILGGIRNPNRRASISPAQMKTNKYGNITKAKRSRIFTDTGKFFVGIPKGRSGDNYEGVWERYGRRKGRYMRIRKVANLFKAAKYNKKLKFQKAVYNTVNDPLNGFIPRFEKNLKNALKTAR
jgi:hypothetical protein